VLLLSVPAFSQGSTGRILGTVSDTSGGVVASATVTVADTERGVTRTLTTDDAGAYNAPNLTAGTYTVRAEAKGFKKLERQNVVVEVGHEVRVDLTVQPGEQTQVVTVTESVPLVETTNATMGGTLENADIVDLPLNGRDYQNLLGLRPGVMLQPGGGPWTQSTNGVRPDESVWLVEGVFNANFFDARPVINMPSPFTDGATILPVDAIQEFNVQENPKAEYGWRAGAVVNVGIKSGTNTLHGDAYAFGRYQGWDARNYFNIAKQGGTCALGLLSACDQLPAQLKQFGAVVGGPIKKDKLFFFGGYEGLRSFIGSAYALSVPTTVAGAGPSASFVDAINAVHASGTPISATSLNLVCPNAVGQALPLAASFACTPDTTIVPNNGSSNSYLSTFPITNTSDNGIGKIDFHPNDKNMISGIFFLGNYNAIGEDHGFTATAYTDSTPIRAWTSTGSWVYTPSSQVVNEFRFGYTRTDFSFINLDVNKVADGTGGYPNTGVAAGKAGGMPSIDVSGFGAGGNHFLGTSYNRPQYFSPNPFYDVTDSISYLKGKHTFKFGGEFSKIEADGAIYNQARGVVRFLGGGLPASLFPCPPPSTASCSTSLEDLFGGAPTIGSLLSGNPQAVLKWTSTAGFVQDDWRVNQKVIVNLGLRYEYVTPMEDAHNHLGSFDPTIGMVQQGVGTVSTVWKANPKAFGPRVGFAWDTTGKGTTVFRAGWSIVRSSWNLATFLGQFGLQNDGTTSLGGVPTGAAFQCGSVTGLTNICPSNGGGTIGLQAVTFVPSQLCWDTTLASCAGAGTQKTVFPVAKATCGDGLPNASLPSGSDASPCDIMGVDPNLAVPYVMNYNVGVTHAFTPNLSVEVEFVGNRARNLLNFADINQTPLGASYCMNALTAAQKADACSNPAKPGPMALQEARPYYTKFPYLGFINYITNKGYSNYNSLQVTLTQRMTHGLLFNLGYTYGHALDNGSENRFGPSPQDATNVNAEYASSDFDIRHRVTFTATYNIPGIKGFGQLLEGWQLNGVVTYATAQPWSSWDGNSNISGTGEFADRWDIVGNAADFPAAKQSIPYCSGFGTTAGPSCVVTNIYGSNFTPAQVGESASPTACTTAAGTNAGLITSLNSFGCYVSANGQSVLMAPALGSYGNQGRNLFRDAGFQNLDFSVFKNFRFKERYGVQFRAEAFNILNHVIPANPYGASSFVNSGNVITPGGNGGGLGFAGLTPDFAAGNPLIGSGSNRVLQLGLKITY
jgi:hypothetical protein